MITDWDDAYLIMPHIPGAEAMPERWASDAAAFRATHPPRVLRYGDHPRRVVDVFLPDGEPCGLAVWVHGGYWKNFDRSDWSHFAAGARARGWAVALPGYVLTPEVRISRITADVTRAIALVAAEFAGPIRLSGHSAGGHLVARQVCDDTALPAAVLSRIERTLPISGIFDLRPLLRTENNRESFRLDEAEAMAESPALRRPVEKARVHAWVGADERPEFVRQNALLANVWTGLGADMQETVESGIHHLNVIDPLTDPGSPIVEAFVGG
jgi:alpha-beta hydrolase superfamily lysophospholipase